MDSQADIQRTTEKVADLYKEQERLHRPIGQQHNLSRSTVSEAYERVCYGHDTSLSSLLSLSLLSGLLPLLIDIVHAILWKEVLFHA